VATEPKTIHVTSGGVLARLVEAASKAPVILEKDGIRYRLSREEDEVWAHYDSEAVLSAIRAASGTLTREEGEELKAYIYRAREEGSRPADRP
jgi:hypothetical protein